MADTTPAPTIEHTTLGSVKRLKITWVSTAGGAVEKTVNVAIDGELLNLVTDPGAAAPTANYDITIEDDGGIDILNANGMNRHTTTTENVTVDSDTAGRPVAVYTPSYVFKVAAAGASKGGVAILYYR